MKTWDSAAISINLSAVETRAPLIKFSGSNKRVRAQGVPTKIATENQLLRLLGNSPLQVEIKLLH